MAKQLSLPERYVIERMLHQDYSFASIGRNLDRSASTIARDFALSMLHKQIPYYERKRLY